jgi:hypothetical protein
MIVVGGGVDDPQVLALLDLHVPIEVCRRVKRSLGHTTVTARAAHASFQGGVAGSQSRAGSAGSTGSRKAYPTPL